MATVVWGGTGLQAVQPSQGEMRRFIVRNRVDCRNGNGMVIADTNKILIIKAGWFVNRVFARLIKAGTHGDVYAGITDSAGAYWAGTGGSWSIGGSAGSSTQGTGAISLTGPTAVIGTTLNQAFGATGNYYGVADYLVLALGSTGATFDGVIDVMADVIDTNPYENPASYSD